jgi:PAS domain S-box-containing protein
LAREPLADAFFGFPDTEEADLGFVTDALGLLEYPAFVVGKDLRIVTANLQGRDNLAWMRSVNPRDRDTGDDVLPPTLAEFVLPRIRKRVHDVVKNVAVIEDMPYLFDLFLSKGRIRGETYTFVVLMTASTGRKPRRISALGRLLEGFGSGAFVGDRDVNFVDINDAFLDLVGFSSKELIGHHLTEFNTSEQARAFGEVFEGMIASPRILRSPAVTYSPMRREAFVGPLTAWTITDKDDRAVGLAVLGGFRSRPKREMAQVERRHVLLEKAADLMSEAIFITDLDGDILVKNPAADRLLTGVGDRETRNVKTDVPWEIPGTVEAIFTGLAEGKEQSIFNTAALLPSGKAVLKIRTFALRRVSDVIQEVVFVCEDISQEEYLKLTLFQTTRRLSDDKALRDRVLNSIDIPYIVVSKDLTILEANEAVAGRLGKPRRELIGLTLTDANPNLEKTGMLDHIRSAMKTGEIARLTEYAHVTHDGRDLTLTTTVVPVELGGKRVCALVAEAETPADSALSEMRLKAGIADAIMDEVKEGVFLIDRDGTFLEVSDGAAKGSNLPREHIVGKNVRDLIALAEEEDLFAALWKKVLSAEEPFRSGVIKSRSLVDDSKQFIECFVSPLKGPDGSVEKYVVVVHYLREIKGLEQQIADYTANLENMVVERTRELRASNALLASTAERVGRTARSGDIMTSLTDRESVLDAFLKQARDVLGADYVRLALKDGASTPPKVEERSLGTESEMDAPTGEVVEEAMAQMMLTSPTRERVWAPLDNLLVAEFAAGRENCVFTCSREDGRFTSIDVDLAHLLSVQLSFALPMAGHVAEQRREREKADCLRRIVFRIAGITSVKEAVQAVAEELSRIISADCFFWLVKEDGGRVWVTEIFRRDRPTDGRSMHIEFKPGEDGEFDLFAGGAEGDISCERLSDAGGARSAECRFVSGAEKDGVVGAVCKSMAAHGFIDNAEGACAIVQMHLAHHSPSFICAHRENGDAFADDDVCFMCLAASAVGRVWFEADAASAIRRLVATGENITEMAHDIKYPMAKIVEFLKRLATGEMNVADTRDSAGSLLSDAETLAALSREFVDLYKPGSDQPEFVDVAQVLMSSLALARVDLERKSVTVETKFGERSPLPPVFASRSDLSRVFINLVANAHDAVDEGGWIRLNAFVDSGDGGKPRVTLTFENSGPPVPPGIRDSLFSPFKSGKEGGTGLGLFSAKRRANANGGDLTFEVDEDGTERFKVWFPAAFE